MPVEWNQAQIGDLAFLAIPETRKVNHVGVVVGFDNSEPMVAHCSSSYNNVVVTEGWGSGFRYIRRPVILMTRNYIHNSVTRNHKRNMNLCNLNLVIDDTDISFCSDFSSHLKSC